MITQSHVLTAKKAPRLNINQIRRVGQLIYRLDAAGIKYAAGLLGNEPGFVLDFAGACTPPLGLAQTERLIDLIETAGCLQ
jgi:hypothetical protein